MILQDPAYLDADNIKVTEHAHVQETIDKSGAFVEVVLWVPRSEIEPKVGNTVTVDPALVQHVADQAAEQSRLILDAATCAEPSLTEQLAAHVEEALRVAIFAFRQKHRGV